MSNVKTFILLVYCFISLIFLNACLKNNLDFDKMTTIEWTPEFAVPLVFAELSVADIVARDTTNIVVVDQQSGQVALVYSGEIFSFNVRDIIQLPEFSIEHIFNLNAQEVSDFASTGSITKSSDFSYDISDDTDMQIESLTLEDGILEIEIVSDFQHSGELVLSAPGLEKNGSTFEKIIPLPYQGTQIQVTEQIDLADYTVNMDSGTQGNNEITFEFVFSAQYEGNPVSVADLIRIENTFEKLEFFKISGDIGQYELLLETDTITVDIFENNQAGYFELVNPFLRLNISNSFGMPIDVFVEEFKSVNLYTIEETQVFFDGFLNPFGINAPDFNAVGDSAKTTVMIDNQNSNFGSLLNSAPQKLIYAMRALSNPESATSPAQTPNFITNRSSLKIETDILLPLEGLAYDLLIVDTLDFSFGEQIEEVDSIGLRVITDNMFPLNASLQIYFADEQFNLIDSVFTDDRDIILSGLTNQEGVVVDPVRKVTEIPFSSSRVPSLTNASYVIINAELKTSNAPDGEIVKVKDYYKLIIRMGLYLAGTINL